MKRFGALLAVFVLLGCGAWAGEINLPNAQGNGLTIGNETKGGAGDFSIRMSCSIDKIHFYDAKTPKGDFTVVYNPSFAFGGEYGCPQLPVITKLVQVPFGAKFNVSIKNYDVQEYKLADHGISKLVYPHQPSAPKDGSEVPFVYEPSSYITKGENGLPMTSFKEIGIMRHMRLAQLIVAPVKYDATENKLVVYNNLDFEITFTDSDLPATKAEHETHYSPAFSWLEKMVYVPETLRFSTKNAAQGYVIVTDPAFKDAMGPFVELKTQQGFKVSMVTTEQFGTGAAITENLKKYLHDLYKNPPAGVPAPSYVLFVGDNEQIPAFKGKTGSHITELYFVAVTEGDFLPEMLTGRFSAQNLDQLKPQLEKTIEYEKGQFADTSFLDDVVLTAGWDSSWAKSHGWPHINYATANYINSAAGFDKVSKYLSAGSQQNVAAIVADVARGVSFMNYTAHGSSTSWADPSFTQSDIAKLGNKGKYPFVVGNCCLTSKFEVSTCFAEAWLRAKDSGAIGYVGGTNSTYWDEDIWWGVGLHAIVKPNDQGVPPAKDQTGPGALDAMFEGAGTTAAGFMLAGNLAVESSTSSRKQYYWEVYHLMGDPALKPRIGK